MSERIEIDQVAESRWQIRHITDAAETTYTCGYVIGFKPILVVRDGVVVEDEAPVYAYTPADRAKGVVRIDELTDAEAVVWVAAAMFPGLGITGGRRWES